MEELDNFLNMIRVLCYLRWGRELLKFNSILYSIYLVSFAPYSHYRILYIKTK